MLHWLAGARWETRTSGLVSLTRDWMGPGVPPLRLNEPGSLVLIEPADIRHVALRAGHWMQEGEVRFFLWKTLVPDLVEAGAIVAGPFNAWGQAADLERWTLHAACVGGADGFVCAVPLRDVVPPGGVAPFKFKLPDGRWIEPPHDADNVLRDWQGHRNLTVDARRTGQHCFRFVAEGADALEGGRRLRWEGAGRGEAVEILACGPLDHLQPTGRLGAMASEERTSFRLFAPRATAAAAWWDNEAGVTQRVELKPEGQGIWSAAVPADLTGRPYRIAVDEQPPLVDPWALRVTRRGDERRGLISGTDDSKIYTDGFTVPRAEDLIVLEAHVRDLLSLAGPASHGGFKELAAWIQRDGAYLRRLGVNALELLPCAEYERGSDPAEYHWGYMPIAAFAPATAYAPAGQGPEAFRELVAACHAAGLAVIVDLVLNHFGSPNDLLVLDTNYWFRRDAAGELSNFSGCGNDFRAESPVGARLIAESVLHWLGPLGADGVRLDLAELLGTPILKDVEAEVRARAPGKILIAEPWSFRGHVGPELDRTTWTSWDDGFREFLPAYVRGHARAPDLLHQMAGLGIRPTARLRYLMSHDDHAWVDRITARPDGNGSEPLPEDILRNRLGHLLLLASVGVPMLAAGQDFLHSKQGVGNTWRRGDLNALSSERLQRFASEHAWVATLIHFRRSEKGAPLRPRETVSQGWMRPAFAPDSEAFAAEFNADGVLGAHRILVAANPHPWEVKVTVKPAGWTAVALSPLPDCAHAPGVSPAWKADELVLPPLACGLWWR